MRFADLARRDSRHIDLATGAFLIAADEYPGLDINRWLRHLDQLAELLAPRQACLDGDFMQLEGLSRFLYRDLALKGNQDDFYDPRNSYLNDVLERRLGIPITLAIVAMEIGKRIDVPLIGICFPGRFLLRHARHPELFIDPYDEGRFVTLPECSDMLWHAGHKEMPFHRDLLKPSSTKEILMRLLHNLRGVYLESSDMERSIRVIDRLALLDPGQSRHRRDRGLLRVHCGDRKGLADLESYLSAEPEAADREQIESLIARVKDDLGVIH